MTSKDVYYTLQTYIGTHKSTKVKEAFNVLEQIIERLEELKKENQELKKKLAAEFEDSADEICKIATERDKLLDENIELQIKIRDLKEKNKILSHNNTNIVMTDTEIMKRNLELQTEIQELKEVNQYYKDKYLDLYNSYQNCEDLKRKKAIEIIKNKDVNIDLFISSSCLEEYNNDYSIPLTQQEFDLLKEVLGNEI